MKSIENSKNDIKCIFCDSNQIENWLYKVKLVTMNYGFYTYKVKCMTIWEVKEKKVNNE